jgi:TP901 family phage tail tape measure protein
MAFERIGLGGVLRFDDKQALSGMRRAQAGFARLQGSAQKLGAGLSMMGDGMRNAGIAMLPLTAGMGFGAAKAAKFEKQMSAVGAITRSSADELAALSNEAKRQGVVSVFSAQQSAEAMEFMGRAGFDTKQVIDGLGGVMAAAAADGISLATSSDIVARVVKGMGLEIEQASHVADVLALTSAKTNTDITALGEAFTYGAPQAKALGVSLEETTAAFGLMADAGLRGSLGGTSFMNMLVKLSKPSAKANKMIANMGIKLEDAQGRLKPLPDIIGMFKTKLDKVNSTTKRAAMIAEIFGLRGAKAYSALSLAGREKMAMLTEDLEASSFGLGAAQEMANKRLDNFLGALTLFGSSLEAVAIEFFGPFLGVFKETTQDMTAALNSVLFAVQGLKQIREQAALSAVKAAKRESTAIVEQNKLLGGLARREQATAKAGIAAIQARIIGEEKLTREQQRARSRSFAEFVKGNLGRQRLTKAERKTQLDAINAFIERNEKGELTAFQREQMERQYLRTLVTLGAKGKKLGKAEAARRATNLELLIRQRAEAAKFEAAAESVILQEEKLNEIEKEHGRTARLIAEGVLQAIDEIKAGFNTAVAAVKNFGQRFGETVGEGNLSNFARIATIGTVVAAALAPVFLGFSAVGFVIKSVVLPQIMGLFKILSALKPALTGIMMIVRGVMTVAFWPLAVAIGVVGTAFLLLRKQGESITDTFWRLWGAVKDTVGSFDVWKERAKVVFDTAKQALAELPGMLMFWREEGESTLDALSRGVGIVGQVIRELWTNSIQPVLALIGQGFGTVVQWAAQVWTDGIKPFLVDAWQEVVGSVSRVVDAARSVWQAVRLVWSEFGIAEAIKARISGLWEVFKSGAEVVGSAIKAVVGVFTTVVWPFVTGFVSGFSAALSPLLSVWASVWSQMFGIFDAVWATIKDVLSAFSGLWSDIVDMFVDDSDRTSTKWAEIGQTIGTVVAWIAEQFLGVLEVVAKVVKGALVAVSFMIRGIVKVFAFFARTGLPVMLLPFKALWESVRNVSKAVIELFQGSFTQGLKRIFLAIVDIVLLPTRMLIKGIVQLAKAMPSVMGKVISPKNLEKLNEFAKFGFSGAPKTPPAKPKAAKEPAVVDNVIDLATERRKRRMKMPAFEISGKGEALATSSKIAEIMERGGIKSEQRAVRIAKMLEQTNKEATRENIVAANTALGTVAQRRRKEAKDREKAADKELMANVKVEDKRTLDITNKMCVDGEAASVATARHKRNVFERNGATHEPYLAKISTETGVRMAGNSRS